MSIPIEDFEDALVSACAKKAKATCMMLLLSAGAQTVDKYKKSKKLVKKTD